MKCSGNVNRQRKYWEMQQIMRKAENTKHWSLHCQSCGAGGQTPARLWPTAQQGRHQRGGWCCSARGAPTGEDDFPSCLLFEFITLSHHFLQSLPLSQNLQSRANSVPPVGQRRTFAVPCPSWETLPCNIILSTWDSDFCSVWDLTAEDKQRKTEGRRLLMLHTNIVHHPVWGSTRVDAATAGGAGAAGSGQKTSIMTRGQRWLQQMWTLLSPPSRAEILLFFRRLCVFSSQCQGQNGNTGLCEKVMWEALPA